MGLGHSPRIVTDGLVLALDAGNPKNYNAGISTNWTDKVGGNNGTLVGGTNHNDGPFVGAGYVEFDGTGDYVDIASSSDFIFDGDFTIEYWIYREGGNVWFDLSNTSDYTNAIQFYSSSGNFHFYMNSSTATNVGGAGYMDVPTNQWVHHAVSRSGTTCRVFADGVLKKTTTLSGTAGNDTRNILRLGAQSYGGPTAYFQGKLSNLRIVKGTALYTSDFTPPTKPLTAITNTTLLTCQGNTIADASSSAHSISVTGGAEANLGFPKSAFVFDGSNDYVDIGASSDFNIGTGDFTVEGWVNSSTYSTDNGAYRRFFVLDGPSTYNATGQLAFMVENTNGKLYVFGDSIGYTSSGILANGSWNHFAVTRIGNTIYLYVNGAAVGSTSHTGSFSPNSGSPRPRIGAFTSSAGRWNGKISGVKIYKGKGLTASEVEQNYNALKGRYV